MKSVENLTVERRSGGDTPRVSKMPPLANRAAGAAPPDSRDSLRPRVERALELCREEEWTEGLPLARALVARYGNGDDLPGAVFSFVGYGVARFDHQLAEGLSLCRHGVRRSPADPETYYNLARIELLARRRKPAVKALGKGLALDPRHRALRQLQRAIGWRHRPVLTFLRRENWINRVLGRLRSRFSPDPERTDRAIW